MTEYKIRTDSQAATERLAEQLGVQIRGGDVIELIGDVGVGKTAFVRGLARGIGSKDRVSSPTFTINNIYSSPTVNLYHYDFYRLGDFQVIKDELKEVISEPENSAVLEWAEEVESVLPDDHIKIKIETEGEDSRKLHISIPEKLSHVKVKQ